MAPVRTTVMMPLPRTLSAPVLRIGVRRAVAALILVAAMPVLGSQAACTQRYVPKGQPIFEEEFSGDSLDRMWRTEMSWGRYTAGQLEHYDPAALAVGDGHLSISASEEGSRDRPYRSGVVASFGEREFTYGYFEIRARMPKGRGLWPAFWLAASDGESRSEIDVVEFLGHEPRTMHMAMHYDTPEGEHLEPQSAYEGPDFTTDYHTYAVDWRPDAVVWYVDGIERARQTEGVPDEPMYLIANLGVGGEWPGEPDERTTFPARYVIDYIRVYEP